MRSTIVLSGMLAGTLLLAACGGSDTDGSTAAGGSNDSSSSTSSSQGAEFNDADVAFVSGMKPHHEQAVEMSDIVLQADPTPEVAALAERIKAAQQPEIEQLDEMLDVFGADAGGHSGMDMDGGMDMGGMAGHGGMMSAGQMQMLQDASGTEVSRMFLEMMTEHHEGAVEAAETELQDGEYGPALALAQQIRDTQETEIAQMQQLLAQL